VKSAEINVKEDSALAKLIVETKRIIEDSTKGQ